MADIDLPDLGSTSWGTPLNTAIEAVNADVETRALDGAVMHTTGDEGIAGVKTFANGIVVPDASLSIAKVTGLASALDALAEASGAGVVSVNAQTGTVVLDAEDVGALPDDATFDDIADGSTNVAYTATEKSKLFGIEADATKNASDSALRARSSHTGSQASSTISDFAERARDVIGAALVAGPGIAIAVNDAADTITITNSGGGGGGGGAFTRDTVTYTTDSLPATDSESSVIGLGQGYHVYRVQVDKKSRVRLYSTAVQRDADVARPFSTAPTGNHGVVLDILFTAPGYYDITPVVTGVNFDVGNAPITITNEDASSGAITVDITFLRTE